MVTCPRKECGSKNIVTASADNLLTCKMCGTEWKEGQCQKSYPSPSSNGGRIYFHDNPCTCPMKRIQLHRHPATLLMGELVDKIESLGASPQLTETVILAGKVRDKIHDILDHIDNIKTSHSKITKIRLVDADGIKILNEGITLFDGTKELPQYIEYKHSVYECCKHTKKEEFVQYIMINPYIIELHII